MTLLRCKNLSPLGPKKHRKLLLIRAFVGTIGLVTFFFAFKLLDPSDCLAITHTSVIITSILARIFLKEKLTFAHLIALVLTACGVVFIAKPRSIFNSIFNNTSSNTSIFTTNNYSNETINQSMDTSYQSTINTSIGIVIALFCALSSSTVQVVLKKLCTQKVHFSIVIIYVTYVGIPVTFTISLALILTGFSHENFSANLHLLPTQILYSCIGGVLGVLSQILLNLSLQYEEASKIAILKTLDVFFTFLFQYLILNISIDMFSFIGSCSILFGTFIILSFKLIDNRMIQKQKSMAHKNGGSYEKDFKKGRCSFFTSFINFKF
jgi:drug/metabolite transporter (DMT)-like permease